MRTFFKALAAAAIGLGLAGAAQAAPAGPIAGLSGSDSLVEHVAQGCGRGFFRGPRGFCRPMFRRYYAPRRFYGRPVFVPRRYYAPRRYYGRPVFVPRRYYAPRRFYGRPVYGPRRFYGPRW